MKEVITTMWILVYLTVHLSAFGLSEKEESPFSIGDALLTSAFGPAHVPNLLSHAGNAVIMIFFLFVILGKVCFFLLLWRFLFAWDVLPYFIFPKVPCSTII